MTPKHVGDDFYGFTEFMFPLFHFSSMAAENFRFPLQPHFQFSPAAMFPGMHPSMVPQPQHPHPLSLPQHRAPPPPLPPSHTSAHLPAASPSCSIPAPRADSAPQPHPACDMDTPLPVVGYGSPGVGSTIGAAPPAIVGGVSGLGGALVFTQAELDMVLYGYTRGSPSDRYHGHALSGLRLASVTHSEWS